MRALAVAAAAVLVVGGAAGPGSTAAGPAAVRQVVAGPTADAAAWIMPARPAAITATGIARAGITPAGITPAELAPAGITAPGITQTGIAQTGPTPTGPTPTELAPERITPAGMEPDRTGAATEQNGTDPAGTRPSGTPATTDTGPTTTRAGLPGRSPSRTADPRPGIRPTGSATRGPRPPDAAAPPIPATGPPLPPPAPSAGPPPGVRPGRTPGLRPPAACAPPPADAPPAVDTGAQRLQLAAVHRLATGTGQLVAVIDTGVHPDSRFGDRLRGGGDYVTGGDGLDDCDGHGTAVAGLIGATGGGRDGFVGMAPGARLVSIRQSSPSFRVPASDGALRPAGDVATLADAIVLAVREGAGVVNISEAVCLPAARAASQGASIQAALRYAADSDVVVVAAAGNAGVGSCAAPGREPADQVSLPGWYGDDILTVGAVGPDDAPAGFTVPGSWVDIAAPGTDLRSLAVGGGTTGTGVEGTSFAAPWVAGLAALVRERYPGLTARQVTDRILATARRAPGGESDALGRGVVDPVAALTAVPAVLTPGVAVERTAELPGTALAPPAAARPADLLAVGALLTACVTAAWLLRRRPVRRG